VSCLKIFGYVAYALIASGDRSKLDKNEKYIFVGYSDETKGY